MKFLCNTVFFGEVASYFMPCLSREKECAVQESFDIIVSLIINWQLKDKCLKFKQLFQMKIWLLERLLEF